MTQPTVARPTIDELLFQVYDRPIHPELIETLQHQQFRKDRYRLDVHITPAGHTLRYQQDELTLVEVLATQSAPLPEHRQLFAHRVGNERNELHTPSTTVCYQTCFQVERLPAPVFFRLHDEIRRDGEKDGVLHLLTPHDRLGLSPITFINLQARPGSMLAHVYHTYPAEYAVVKSQTLIETK